MFAPYDQTTELWGESQAMDAPQLYLSKDLENTMTNPYITSQTKVTGQPQGLPLLILTTPSVPILPSQFQQIPGYIQQKYSTTHCLNRLLLTDTASMT